VAAENTMKKLDTRLECEGAEFLVLGHLLLNKIAAYKAYTNMPGYDLVAVNLVANTAAKIQVKSRWRTGATGFPISNFDCDFVVAALLNRGSIERTMSPSEPSFYVIPVDRIRSLPQGKVWNKVDIKKIPNLESYRGHWSQIKDFLSNKLP